MRESNNYERNAGENFFQGLPVTADVRRRIHSYHYAWAERALKCGYPERFAQQALGHNSKAVHHAYSKHAEVTVPLDDWEKQWKKDPRGVQQPKVVAVDFQSPARAQESDQSQASSAEQFRSLATCAACRRAGRSFAAQVVIAAWTTLEVGQNLRWGKHPTVNPLIPTARLPGLFSRDETPNTDWRPDRELLQRL